MGCSGKRLIYVGWAKQPEEAKGLIRIAENRKIQVTVVGVENFTTKMDLGGMYVFSGPDVKGMKDALDKVPKTPVR